MTPTQFIVEVENRLGWTPPVTRGVPLWKARSIEAMKLKRAMASHKCDWDDMQLALEYSVRRREPGTPSALCWRVKAARELAVPVVHDVDETAQSAVEWELGHDLPDADFWIGRLNNSRGAARAAALTQWQQHRGIQQPTAA